mgnify:FL=1
MNINIGPENHLQQQWENSETDIDLRSNRCNVTLASHSKDSPPPTESPFNEESDEEIFEHFESMSSFRRHSNTQQDSSASQGRSLTLDDQEKPSSLNSECRFRWICKSIKVACNPRAKNIFLSTSAIVLELILTVLYATNILSLNTVCHFSLGLAIISLFAVISECSNSSRPRIEQNGNARSNPSTHQPTQSRTDNPNLESERREEELYNQMLRRILVSRLQLTYINHFLNRLQRQVEFIENSLSNENDSQIQPLQLDDIDLESVQIVEEFLLGTGLLDPLSQQQGMSIEEIDKIMPVQNYQSKVSANEENLHEENKACCTICLEDFEDGQVIRISSCEHIFHKNCIDNWLGIRSTCPNCKHELNDQDENAEIINQNE